MTAFGEPRFDEPRTRRSTKVALVLLGTAGVIGVGTLVHAWVASRHQDDWGASSQPLVPLSPTQTYANNAYIPGVGYYHAPYHGWFPFPYNYHDPRRGYFGGGMWQAAPLMLSMLRSQPSNDAVVAAMAAQRAREQAEQQRPSSSGFFSGFRGSGSSSGGSWFSSSRSGSSSTPSSSGSHSIMRGGFGSSGHSSGGAS